MPRGGSRPGAGRPKGAAARAKNADKVPVPPVPKVAPKTIADDVAATAFVPNLLAALGEGKTPLAYMLVVMNDDTAEKDRRDRMAVAAAPYVHAKQGESGKKDAKQDAAKKAGAGKFAATPTPLRMVK
jgi:phage terminase small subunit